MFICPGCQVQLKTLRNRDGVYWECPQCGGRSATIALLRKIAPRELVNKFWQAVRAGTRPSSRVCPACLNRMAEAVVPGAAESHGVDACVRCQFVWFDPAEFEDLPKAERPLSYKEGLPPEARQRLAVLEVEQMAEQAREEAGEAPPESWWAYVAGFFGMPVEVGSQGTTRIPVVTFSIALLILVLNLMVMTNWQAAIESFGLVPRDCFRYGGVTFLTAFLLHGGFFHLASNLYFLMVFGDNVEDYLGRWRYVLLVVAAALLGDLLHILGGINSVIPSIGASGGISGIIAFYACAFPHAKLAILFRSYVMIRWMNLSAIWLFLVWIGLQVLGVALEQPGMGGIAYRAHLGGALVGVFAWFVSRRGGEGAVRTGNMRSNRGRCRDDRQTL